MATREEVWNTYVDNRIAIVLMSLRARLNRGQDIDEALTRTIEQYRFHREDEPREDAD